MKKITRVLCLILALVCATMMFTGCKEEVPEVAPRVAAIAGPTGVGMVHIMEQYDVKLAAAADELIGKVANNEVDIAVLAVPKRSAQEMANLLCSYGIKGFWNFAPLDLKLPGEASVVNVHLDEGLQVLSFRMLHNDM